MPVRSAALRYPWSDQHPDPAITAALPFFEESEHPRGKGGKFRDKAEKLAVGGLAVGGLAVGGLALRGRRPRPRLSSGSPLEAQAASYGIRNVSYAGMDPAMATQINARLAAFDSEYPGVLGKIDHFGTGPKSFWDDPITKHAVAASGRDRKLGTVLFINPRYAKNLSAMDSVIGQFRKQKYIQPKGSPVDAVLSHELGHVLHKTAPDQDALRTVVLRPYGRNTDAEMNLHLAELRTGLSERAADSPAETIAESFAWWHLSTPAAREQALDQEKTWALIGQELDRQHRRKPVTKALNIGGLWSPIKHPRGPKGQFRDTPDKPLLPVADISRYQQGVNRVEAIGNARSIEEATIHTSAIFPNATVDLTGVDLPVANRINRELARLATDYPEPASWVTSVDPSVTLNPEALMEVTWDHHDPANRRVRLGINSTRTVDDLNPQIREAKAIRPRAIQRRTDTGELKADSLLAYWFQPSGSTVESVVAHEYAHIMHGGDIVVIDGEAISPVLLDAVEATTDHVERQFDLLPPDIDEALAGDAITTDLINELGLYTQLSPLEFQAEAFSAWRTSPNPGPYATIVGRVYDRRFYRGTRPTGRSQSMVGKGLVIKAIRPRNLRINMAWVEARHPRGPGGQWRSRADQGLQVQTSTRFRQGSLPDPSPEKMLDPSRPFASRGLRRPGGTRRRSESHLPKGGALQEAMEAGLLAPTPPTVPFLANLLLPDGRVLTAGPHSSFAYLPSAKKRLVLYALSGKKVPPQQAWKDFLRDTGAIEINEGRPRPSLGPRPWKEIQVYDRITSEQRAVLSEHFEGSIKVLGKEPGIPADPRGDYTWTPDSGQDLDHVFNLVEMDLRRRARRPVRIRGLLAGGGLCAPLPATSLPAKKKRRISTTVRPVTKAFSLTMLSDLFDPKKHPRGPGGKFRTTPDQLLPPSARPPATPAPTGPIPSPVRVQKWQADHGTRLDSYASARSMTPDAYRAAVATDLARHTAALEPRARLPLEALEGITSSGRMKSQFETGTTRGILGNEARAAAEGSMFSYSPTHPPSQRPIYGYLGPRGGKGDARGVSQYGEVEVRFKDTVRARSTFTDHDSLSTTAIPTPLDKPRAESVNSARDPLRWADSRPGDPAIDPNNPHMNPYWEAQIHGGVSLSDIEEVRLPDDRASYLAYYEANPNSFRPDAHQDQLKEYDRYDAITEALKRKGVKVTRTGSGRWPKPKSTPTPLRKPSPDSGKISL